MTRKLLNVCVVCALVVGCWGGVLAAAACPHVGCETMAGVPDSAATYGVHMSDHSQHSAGLEDHSGHAQAHGVGHAAESPVREQLQTESEVLTVVTSGAHDLLCSHCVGRSDSPPSPNFELQSNYGQKVGKEITPRASGNGIAPTVFIVREITPAHRAPPGSSDRHLLLNVFRI